MFPIFLTNLHEGKFLFHFTACLPTFVSSVQLTGNELAFKINNNLNKVVAII